MGISRQFTVGAQFPGEEVDPDELAQALVDLGPVLRRVGGAVAIQTVRMPVEGTGGEMVTERVIIKWLSRTDTGETPEVPVQVLPEPEAEPVEEPIAV